MDIRFLLFACLAGLTAVNSSSPLDKCLKTPFHGITETSPDGTRLGKVDRQDWGCFDSQNGLLKLDAAQDVPPVPPPTDICLVDAYPNPADVSVRVGFTLPTAMHVRVSIYGQNRGHGRPEALLVRIMADENLLPGFFEVSWDLRDDHGVVVPPGIYRAVLEAQGVILCGDIEVR